MKSIRLTPRQAQVLSLLAQGLTHKEIARKLFISDVTVASHVWDATHGNECRNVVDLCVYAALQGKLNLEAA